MSDPMYRVVTLLLFFSVSWAHGQVPGVPSVAFEGKTLSGRAAINHQVSKRSMKVLEAKGCSAQVAGESQIRVSDSCAFMRGQFSYHYQEAGTKLQKQVLIGFSLTRKGAQSHGFMESAPIVISESL